MTEMAGRSGGLGATGVRLLRTGWARTGLLGTVSAVVLGGLAYFGAGHGYPVQDVRLLSGSAWLASSQVGQVTLMDGASAEVAAQVRVAAPGHSLDVVQQGANAYAVDHTAGTLRRVDGATFDLTSAETPIPGAHAGLTAFANQTDVYALDTQRGLLTTADPHTLAPTGPPVSLAAQLSADTATVDDAGRLWVIDNSTGDLTRVSGAQRDTHRGVARPGRSMLTLVDGNPVVVDTVDRKAITVRGDTGDVAASLDLDLRPTDTIQVSGSPHSNRLYIVASRGVLDICDLGAGSCDGVVPLDTGNNDLGAAIEAANRLFVPDYTTGKVWIIDLVHPAIVATADVLTPAGRFQLLTRDGVVFFNDPNTNRAGVIHLDGGVTPIEKYDPADPTKGLHGNTKRPANGAVRPPSANTPPANQRQPPASAGTPPPPANGQVNPPPVTTLPPVFPPPVDNPPPGGGTPPTTTTPPTGPPTVHPIPTLHITLSRTSPVVDTDVGLKVSADTGTVAGAHWNFGDGATADGVTTTHRWASVQTYLVSVQAVMADGQHATTSVSVNVTRPPDVTVPDVIGQTDTAAEAALGNVGLTSTVRAVFSNSVAQGLVIDQAPGGGTTVPPGTAVTLTVSSGKAPPFSLITGASGASWSSSAGGPLPFPGSDIDKRGFALLRNGPYTIDNGASGDCVLQDGSAPSPYLETHPEWKTGGFIAGTYSLSTPIAAGDHFRASVGFIKCPNLPPILGVVKFQVLVDGVAVATVDADNSGTSLHPIDADLSAFVGATHITLTVTGSNSASERDWASWVDPTVGG
jgi:hypothetical protein